MSQEISVKPYRALQIIEEQTKKNRTSRISWTQITKNKKYGLLISQNGLYANHQEHLKRLKLAFRKAFKEINCPMVDKNGDIVPRYYYDSEKDEFVRRNEFQEIKNEQTLLKFVQKSPKGVIVSDELLQYTYKDIQKDIEKLLNDKKVKKINSSSKNKTYYLFANIIEKQYDLGDNYEYFGKDDYLQICKKNLKSYGDGTKDDRNASSGINFSFANQKFNEWVPGYAELKKKWLQDIQAKEKLKFKS